MKDVVTKRTLVRVFFWPGAVLTVAVVLFLAAAFSAQKQVADAQVVNFYSSECSGGWDGAELASGEPQVNSHASPDYTKENSAYLENKISPITCRGYTGILPPETYHTRVMVRFSWKQEMPPPLPPPEVAVPDTQSESVGTSTGTTTEAIHAGESSTAEVGTTTPEIPQAGTNAATTSDESSTTVPTVSESSSSTPVLPGNDSATSSPSVPSGADTVATTTTSTPVPAGAGSESTVVAPAEPKTEPAPDPASLPVPTPTPTPTPVSVPDVVSWWPLLLPAYAHAEELATSSSMLLSATDTPVVLPVTSSLEISSTTATTTFATSSAEIAISSPVDSLAPAGAQFIVQYTIDGVSWHMLGYVTTVETDVRLEFPKEVLPSLEDISHMQVSITPIIQIDTVQPVYLDAMWLEVSYAPLGELGVHGISDIVPTITPFDGLISDAVATGTVLASTTGPLMTTADFVHNITAVYGIDKRYALVNIMVGTSTKEVWLFDMVDHLVHRIGRDKAQIGDMQASAKDGMVFWLDVGRDTIYTYDLRTAGSLHEMTLVGNLPVSAEYVLTFPFTSWQVIWRGDRFYFRTRKTGEVFQDENTDSAQKFFTYFNLAHVLPYDRIQAIGGTFITEKEATFNPVSSSTVESVGTIVSTSTSESTTITASSSSSSTTSSL